MVAISDLPRKRDSRPECESGSGLGQMSSTAEYWLEDVRGQMSQGHRGVSVGLMAFRARLFRDGIRIEVVARVKPAGSEQPGQWPVMLSGYPSAPRRTARKNCR